jgi:putative transposase
MRAAFTAQLVTEALVVAIWRLSNVWNNAAKERFFWWLKTERTGRQNRTGDEARADVFDYIELFRNRKRRHPTIGFIRPHGVRERQAGLA